MRSILLIILLYPIVATAQINRSARELASERIQEYVTKKLFKDRPYTPVSFGQLKEFKDKYNDEMAWCIEHKFVIKEPNSFSDPKGTTTTRTYEFLFYLDDKMKVRRADTYQSY